MKRTSIREGVPGVEAITSRTAATNESQSHHSPLPWQPCESTNGEPSISDAGCNMLVAIVRRYHTCNPEEWQRNRDFIVRACNHHEALLAALKDLLASSGDPNATSGEFDTAAGRAYRAVQKAEGK